MVGKTLILMRYTCILFLLLGITADLKAQVCIEDLQTSNQQYTVGRFDAAIVSATRCILKSDATEVERRDTFRLLALINIAKDDLPQARDAAQRLLELDPAYAPNPVDDPPAFLRMLEDLRPTTPDALPPNLPPVVVSAPSALSLMVGEDAVAQDLRTVFSDPDGQDLRYAATSSLPTVVSVQVDGTQLRITPGAEPGQAQIQITATDAAGASVQAEFTVAVQAQPEITVVQPIGGVVLSLGGGGFGRDLRAVFQASDSAVLTYTTATENAEVATVTLQDHILTITPVGVGETEVTLTATHGLGTVATHPVAITVTPQPSVQVVNPLNPVRLVAGEDPYERDLAADPVVFSDARDGALTFLARSSDSTRAAAQVLGAVLRVTPVAAGEADISVTAENEAGLRARLTFTATVDPPPALVLVDPIRRDDPPEEGPQVKPPGGGSGAMKWLIIGGGVVAASVAGIVLAGGGDDGGTTPPGTTGNPIADPPALPTGN